MGCGRTVISTPFYHAREVVIPERGFLVKFKDSKLFADTIIKILSNPGLKERMERNLYSYTRHMTWPNMALCYMNLFAQCISEIKRYNIVFPKIKLTHITNLTDDFGILQFANYANPDKLSGYTLDDNARALLACAIHYNIFGDKNTLILLKKYLNFIKFVQQNDKKMYNFVDHNRQLKLEYWSDDAHGRAMWALGNLISSDNIPMELRRMAEIIFVKGIKAIDKIKSPRAIAFIIIGLYFYTKVKKSEKIKIRMLSDKLIELYEDKARKDWKWFENYLTYSNSKLPEALFYSYKITRNEKYLTIAKESLDFLISITLKNNIFVPIGQKAWYIKDDRRSHFDQQPIEAASMVQTLTNAYEITLKEKYMKFAGITFQWFLGKNSLNQVVYDENTGGCHDGIGEFSINLNQGTESSLAYLLARLTFEENRKKNYRKI